MNADLQRKRSEPITDFSLESYVPQDHLVRKLNGALDFSFIAGEYDALDKASGVSAEFIAKYLLLIYLYDLRRPVPAAQSAEINIEQVMRENMAYQFFLGFETLGAAVPDYMTVMQAKENLGGAEKWEAILARLLRQCASAGLPHTKGGA